MLTTAPTDHVFNCISDRKGGNWLAATDDGQTAQQLTSAVRVLLLVASAARRFHCCAISSQDAYTDEELEFLGRS